MPSQAAVSLPSVNSCKPPQLLLLNFLRASLLPLLAPVKMQTCLEQELTEVTETNGRPCLVPPGRSLLPLLTPVQTRLPHFHAWWRTKFMKTPFQTPFLAPPSSLNLTPVLRQLVLKLFITPAALLVALHHPLVIGLFHSLPHQHVGKHLLVCGGPNRPGSTGG